MKPRIRIFRGAALAAAALAGYLAGSWGPTSASAARNDARELIDLDREFDAATARNGVTGWLMYFADDGVVLPAGDNPIVGRAAVKDYLEPRFQSPGFSLRWEPIDAYTSGDLGYTYGVSKSIQAAPGGQVKSSYGKYITIWRKRKGEGWKATLAIGNDSPAPARPQTGAR